MTINTRRSIHIEGLSHLTAIPTACRVGPLLTSSVIAPFNPGTREVPEGIPDQYANIFRHMGLMLAEAGGDWRHVAKVDFWLADAGHRADLEAPWLEKFPDPDSRPARHTHLGQVQRMSASFIAYIS